MLADGEIMYAIEIPELKEKWRFETAAWEFVELDEGNNTLFITNRESQCFIAFDGGLGIDYATIESLNQIVLNAALHFAALILDAGIGAAGSPLSFWEFLQNARYIELEQSR